MTKKCIIPGCRSNYFYKKKENKICNVYSKVFRLPKATTEQKLWIKSLPFKNLKLTKDSVICFKHWPANFPTVTVGGRERPRDPPSVWPDIPKSCVPTPLPAPRSTMKTSFTTRTEQADEMKDFLNYDKVDYTKILQRTLE